MNTNIFVLTVPVLLPDQNSIWGADLRGGSQRSGVADAFAHEQLNKIRKLM
ncbi:hypothetical protein [Pedobacter immunditicola]|uniref:hypothetical protein n=1 Tax=Pedobacter immunditicola TaxID=3133440 RepID=UPI0030A516D6